MTLYVKIMSDENLPDSDTRKTYTLYSGVVSVHFERSAFQEGDEGYHIPRAILLFEDGEHESHGLLGNVYVMNADGKTIEKFGPHPIAKGEYSQKA